MGRGGGGVEAEDCETRTGPPVGGTNMDMEEEVGLPCG